MYNKESNNNEIELFIFIYFSGPTAVREATVSIVVWLFVAFVFHLPILIRHRWRVAIGRQKKDARLKRIDFVLVERMDFVQPSRKAFAPSVAQGSFRGRCSAIRMQCVHILHYAVVVSKESTMLQFIMFLCLVSTL